MTTRRNLLIMAGSAALVAACRERSARAPAAAGPQRVIPHKGPTDTLVADTGTGLAVITPTYRGLFPAAVATPGAVTIYATRPDGADTTLVTYDGPTGRETGRARLGGRWVPRLTSSTGNLVALTPPDAPAARSRTEILVADPFGSRSRLELAGNVEPDAFTAESGGLFVLDWLPPTAPDRYRVRMVDLASKQSEPLFTRDKLPVPAGAEEEMHGTSRQAVLSPGGDVLYTLYTHQPDHQHTRDLVRGGRAGVHAFVHVLHLAMRWAYCLDLPEPFGRGPAGAQAIALTPDGGRLVVVDTGAGRLAVADTEALTLVRTGGIPAGTGPASVAAGREGRLFVASGTTIHPVALADGVVGRPWTAGAEVRGLGVSHDGTRLCVGLPDAVAWCDSGTGAEQGRIAVAGLTALRHVG